MKAISFYIVGVINAEDLAEAARIFGPARRRFEEDGRILVLESQSSVHELTRKEARERSVMALVRLLSLCYEEDLRAWCTRLLDEAEADAQVEVVACGQA